MLDLILVYGVHCAVVVFALITLWWGVSFVMKNAGLVDIFWAFGFLIVGAVCLYLVGEPTSYQWLLGLLPIIWGVRLTSYLAKRNFGHAEDKRYVAMRKRAEKKGLSETAWRIRSLFTVFGGQSLLIMTISAPIWVAMATSQFENTPLTWLSYIGATLWLIGFLFEAIGDAQLSAFMKRNKDYDGPIEEKPVLDTGLWRYTRHPNYFGNACMWWGIWLVACQAPWGWTTVFAPIIMNYLLTSVSGKSLLERDMGKRENYKIYIARTSGFFPLPPKDKSEVDV